MISITPTHGRVLDAIYHLTARGYGPSYQEVMTEAGLKSKGRIARYLDDLRSLGLIEYEKGRRRCIGVVNEVDGLGLRSTGNLIAIRTQIDAILASRAAA